MTIAAEQLQVHLEARFPGVRISRLACRLTASGGVSQHSAYNGRYSNAMDIMGGPVTWTRQQNIDLIQEIYDYLADHWDDWSIRKILWQVPDHFGHAHIDFYPMIVTPVKWCGGPETPTWELSDGSTIQTRDPEPENGRYDGEDEMTYESMRAAEFDLWTDDNIVDAYDRGRFQDTDRQSFIDYWTGAQRAERTPAEKARFMTDYYARL